MKRTPPLTAEQIGRFLDHVRSGRTRQEAARLVQEQWDSDPQLADERCHATSSRFKRLYFADETFRALYEEALDASDQSDGTQELRRRLDGLEKLRLVERAFDEYVERALNPERGKSGSSNRALQNLLVLMHRTFRPFLEARVHRHVHSGAVGLFAQPVLDTSKLSLEEQRELIELERRRAVLIEKARPEDESAPVAGEIVEGEFTELAALPAGPSTEGSEL